MSKFLIDTNVFSEIFKANRDVTDYVRGLDSIIDTTIYIECIQGSKSNAEKISIKNYLATFPIVSLTAGISEIAIRLIDQYSNSHGLFLPDALIAASALENDLAILTYNIRDFRFIAGLDCQKPTV